MGAARKCLFTLLSASLLSFVVLFFSSISGLGSPKLFPSSIQRGAPYPPAFAFYISGGRGQREQMFRLLLAVYHPRNRYLLHLSSEASEKERRRLVEAVGCVPAIRAFANVDVVGKPNYQTYMGSTNLVATLGAAAILLRVDSGWNWFVTLSAMDYPLITPDDLSHVFSSVSGELNFIDHTSELGWKELQRINPIMVDPSTYLARRSKIFKATEKRPTPDGFKVFTGSPWMILSRSFLQFCITGWENLPRTLVMYFSNVVSPEESYFHTVICNSEEFKNTTVNKDLRYIVSDNPDPSKRGPHSSSYKEMIGSGALFARKFRKNDPAMDMVDEKILGRGRNRVAMGAWCSVRNGWWIDPCSHWGDVNVLKPGPRAKKLKESLHDLVNHSHSRHCK